MAKALPNEDLVRAHQHHNHSPPDRKSYTSVKSDSSNSPNLYPTVEIMSVGLNDDERTDYHNRQEYQYDPQFDGPLKNRSCTDVICLFIFLAFIIGWAAIGVWAIKNGDPNTLLVPRDSSGLRCGLDIEVKDKPYLFFFDLTKCLDPTTPFLGCQTPQVCVKSCPNEVFYNSPNMDTTKALPYCRNNPATYNVVDCPTWFLPSTELLKRCIYNVADRKHLRWKVASIEGDEITRLKEYLNPVHLWLSLTVHNGISIIKDDQDYHKRVSEALNISVSTITRIQNRLDGNNNLLRSPGKRRHRKKPKTSDLTDSNKADIRDRIYRMYSEIEKRCIPSTSSVNDSNVEQVSAFLSQNSKGFYEQIVNAIGNVKLLSEAEQVAEQVIADIVAAWWKILIGVGLALLACIIYILMLRWVAGIMVWISIGGALAALTAGSYFSYTTWQHWKSDYENHGLTASKTKRDIFLGLFIIVVTVLAIILLILIFLRKRIYLAIALIKEGSKAVSSVTSVLFFPVLPWILQVGVVGYAVCVGVYLATTGEPYYVYRDVTDGCKAQSSSSISNGFKCMPNDTVAEIHNYPLCANMTCKFLQIANEAFYPYLQVLNIFGFFWLAFFVSALGQMVLAQVFAQWYWTREKRTLPFFALTSAFYRTIRYHLGTLAFGSLIIAICRMIRVCLEYIDRKLKQYDNELTRAIMCCLKCFFWCLEKFLKFINKNAYIMCAIHGKNFCASAKDAFMLLLRNIIRVFVLDKVTDFVFFLSKLLVTVGVGAVAYVFFATNYIPFMNNSQLNYGVVPVIVIMIVTYLIASLFFSVYSMAVDTLFLCFLEDCERNNGKDRPYYMSRNLMNIFGKRNKGPKHE